MNVTTIDIIICTYNNVASLRRVLTSLERQQTPPWVKWSVLVVDNNCTDGTAETVKRYMDSGLLPGLRITNESRQGIAFARWRGVQEASGEFIAFIDDDCILATDWLAHAALFARDHPSVGAVGGRVDMLWEQEPCAIVKHYGFARQNYGDEPLQLPETGFTYLVGAGLVIRRDALLAANWLDRFVMRGRCGTGAGAGEDVEIVLRVRNAGYQLWYNPAMRLEHLIPASRSRIANVCRCERAAGYVLPVLMALAHQQTPTLRWRLLQVRSAVNALRRLSIRVVTGRGPKPPASARVELSRAFGRLHGALALLTTKTDAVIGSTHKDGVAQS